MQGAAIHLYITRSIRPVVLFGRCTSVALIACLLLSPLAAVADWIDEMPSIDEVAKAVREQNRQDASTYRASGGLRSVNGINPGPRRYSADDQDWYAARLAGTLRMLRWHMQFEALRETNPTAPPPRLPLSPPRQSTLTRAGEIAAKYRQMELILRGGAGKRASYNKRLSISGRHATTGSATWASVSTAVGNAGLTERGALNRPRCCFSSIC